MPDEAAKKEAQAVLDKLSKKATVSDDELKRLQQHIDLLERAAAGSHHHDHDGRVV
jgi:thioredoxin-like negative regulator of GroEL